MSAPAPRLATYDDLLALPDTVVGEIIGGQLVTSPRPAGRHALAYSAMGGTLVPPFHFGRGGPGGWWILSEPELHLGTNILVPDLAGWRRTAMPELPTEAFITLAPDWVCEILSPSTARFDRVEKLPIYHREGVGHVWLIDPMGHTLEAFERKVEQWALLGMYGGDQVVRIPPFDAVEIELRHLWVGEG